MTKLTVIEGGKTKLFMGKPKVVPMAEMSTDVLMDLFKKNLRSQIEALVISRTVSKQVALSAAADVIEALAWELNP